jgi:hypothetical protein
MVLETKTRLRGYPLILGRPWLAITDAYIGCRMRDMTIANGPSKKNLTLYPLAQPPLATKKHTWGDEEDYMDQAIQHIISIDMSLSLRPPEEGVVMSNFLQNMYSIPFLLGDVIMQYWELTRTLIEEPIWKRLCLVE